MDDVEPFSSDRDLDNDVNLTAAINVRLRRIDDMQREIQRLRGQIRILHDAHAIVHSSIYDLLMADE